MCASICVCVCVCMCMHVCICVCACMHVGACACVHAYLCMYMQATCMHEWVCVCVCMCMCVLCVCIKCYLTFFILGVLLEYLFERDKFEVPLIVSRLCEYLKKNGMRHEGLFRVNGNIKVVERLKALFDKSMFFIFLFCLLEK